MERSEQEYITECKRLIEEKFQFGNGQGEVRQRDLEYLADRIEEKSGIVLSLSTLKRFWKKDYVKMPHPATLQAMVAVLGYKDWQEFKLRIASAPVIEPAPVPVIAAAGPLPRHQRSYKAWLWLPIVVAVAGLFWIIAFRWGPVNKKPVIKGPVTFTGNKTVSQGVPNTIIFNYDVTNVDADSFFFQQAWNPFEKVKIDPKNHVYSNIYYLPGFHKAKLIANDSIIKRFRVHITTDGWLPLTRYSAAAGDPINIKKDNAIRNGALRITREDLAASHVDLNKDYILSYFNVREFENTYSDNFSLDTRVLCDSQQTVACPSFALVIISEEHVFFVRIMSKGCERDITIKMGEVFHDGIHKDLSAFGRDLHRWQHLGIQVAGKKATIYLDEQPVYSLTYKNDFGKVVGLVYNFTGTGAIDYVRLRNGANKLVYEEEFNH
jgi:hypothetical protein